MVWKVLLRRLCQGSGARLLCCHSGVGLLAHYFQCGRSAQTPHGAVGLVCQWDNEPASCLDSIPACLIPLLPLHAVSVADRCGLCCTPRAVRSQ